MIVVANDVLPDDVSVHYQMCTKRFPLSGESFNWKRSLNC